MTHVPEEHRRSGAAQPFLERVTAPSVFTGRPFLAGVERVLSEDKSRVVTRDTAGPYQRRLFATRFCAAALTLLAQRLQEAAGAPAEAGEPLCIVCGARALHFCADCSATPLCSAECAAAGAESHRPYCAAQRSLHDRPEDGVLQYRAAGVLEGVTVNHEYSNGRGGRGGHPAAAAAAASAARASIQYGGNGGVDMSGERLEVVLHNGSKSRQPPRKPPPAANAADQASTRDPVAPSVPEAAGDSIVAAVDSELLFAEPGAVTGRRTSVVATPTRPPSSAARNSARLSLHLGHWM
jgi:hypothetical protein